MRFRDGGTRVIVGDQVVGAYQIWLTTSPEPAQVGTLTIDVRLTDPRTGQKEANATIDLQLTGKPLKKIVMSIKTDSTAVEDPKNPDTCNVFALYALLSALAFLAGLGLAVAARTEQIVTKVTQVLQERRARG